MARARAELGPAARRAACGPRAANLQLWGNLTFDWVKNERLVYELDIEPKGLLTAPAGEADWRNLDLTPNIEYSPKTWLDVIAEATAGYTRQTDDVNSFEFTAAVRAALPPAVARSAGRHRWQGASAVTARRHP